MFQLTNSFNQSKWEAQFFGDLEQELKESVFQKKTIEQKTETSEELSIQELDGKEELSKIDSGRLKKSVETLCFEKFDCYSFEGRLIEYNQRIMKAVQAIFNQEASELTEDHSGITVAVTGSDGRQEKLCSVSSKIELMVIGKTEEDLKSPAIKKINQILIDHPTIFHPSLEFKCLATDSLICFNRNSHLSKTKDYRPFPTRALDAMYVAGSKKILGSYKIQFFEELKQQTTLKLLKKFKNSALKPMIKLLKDANAKKDSSNLAIESGKLFYDGDRIKATKYPLLRVVQYQLADRICKGVIEGLIDQEALLKMPLGTVQRIDWLASRKILNSKEDKTEELKKSYCISLIWFAQGQLLFTKAKQNNFSVPKEALKTVAQSIEGFAVN